MHAALRIAALVSLPFLAFAASCDRQPQASTPAPAQAPMSPIEAKPDATPAAPTTSPAASPSTGTETKSEPAAKPGAETPAANPTYTVRGEVASLPGIDGDSIKLHHERIPTFASKDGKVGKDSQGKPGMKPMVMPFGKAPSVSYEGLKVGDKVSATFEVNWSAERPDQRIVITKIEKLSADTALDFEGQPSINDPKPTTPPKEPK